MVVVLAVVVVVAAAGRISAHSAPDGDRIQHTCNEIPIASLKASAKKAFPVWGTFHAKPLDKRHLSGEITAGCFHALAPCLLFHFPADLLFGKAGAIFAMINSQRI